MTLVAHHLEMYMRQIHDTEFPNSVEATEKLLIEQSAEYNKLKVSEQHDLISLPFHWLFFFSLKEEILSVGRQGEELLAEIRRKTEMCADRIGNISSIERFVEIKSFYFAFRFNRHFQLN